MTGKYPILLGTETVGEVSISQLGLYYLFRCTCWLRTGIMCRVTVSCGGINENLGILVPSGEKYTLSKQLPAKLFPECEPEFWITPKAPQMQGIKVDIYPEEPFRYITKLERAYLDRSQGKTMICIKHE